MPPAALISSAASCAACVMPRPSGISCSAITPMRTGAAAAAFAGGAAKTTAAARAAAHSALTPCRVAAPDCVLILSPLLFEGRLALALPGLRELGLGAGRAGRPDRHLLALLP